jgi:hypothetical protein
MAHLWIIKHHYRSLAMDNEPNTAAELERLKRRQTLIIRAAKNSLSLVLLTLAGICVRAALSIPAMTGIFRDFDASLPLITQWMTEHAGVFLVTPVLLAALGLGLLFFARARGLGIVAATVISVVLFLQWQFVVSAMLSPLMQILSRLAGSPK